MMMSRRIVQVLVIGVVLALLASPIRVQSQQRLVPVKLGVTYFGGNLIGLWVAKDRGYFRKYGLEVEFVRVVGSQGMQALLGRSVEVLAGGTVTALAAAAAGADVIDFAVIGPRLPYIFVARPPISAPQELRGKRIGVSAAGLDNSRLGVLLGLRHFGVDPARDKVTLLASGSTPARIAGLVAGSLDATVINLEERQVAIDRGLNVLADLTTLNIPYEANALFAMRRYADDNPKIMLAVLQALCEANSYILNPANRHFVVVTMAKYFGFDKISYAEEATTVSIRRDVLQKPYPVVEGIKSIVEIAKVDFPFMSQVDLTRFVDARWLRQLEQSGFFTTLYRSSK